MAAKKKVETGGPTADELYRATLRLLDPKTPCERKGCGDALEFHNPCSKCRCAEFVVPAAALEAIAKLGGRR